MITEQKIDRSFCVCVPKLLHLALTDKCRTFATLGIFCVGHKPRRRRGAPPQGARCAPAGRVRPTGAGRDPLANPCI